MSDIKILRRPAGDVTILDFTGKLVFGESCKAVRERLGQELGEGKNKILINLRGVKYIDSAGIGELKRSLSEFEKEKGVIKLEHLETIWDPQAVIKLGMELETFSDEGEALASFN